MNRKNKIKPFIVLLFSCIMLCSFEKKQVQQDALPNVILIVADDLGYGDLSCYGQTKFSTPNIDKLAKEGMLFTQHYAGAPVCAPARSALLTGMHTGHTTIRGNKKINGKGDFPLSDSDITLAQIYKEKGYVTGIFGKWGLGYPGSGGDVVKKGFDHFFGYYAHLAAHNYYPEFLWNNNEKYYINENKHFRNNIYSPTLIQDSVLSFIEQNKSDPFFLFVSTTIPHAELAAPAEYIAKYKDTFGKEKPFRGINATIFGAYDSQKKPKATFAGMINLLDDQVGEIIKKLKEEGIYENTIIIFTSDNGPHQEGGAAPDFFNSAGGLRGYKRDLYEGGIRVPLIINWPGKIKPGVSDLVSASWDLMPTFADIIEEKQPKNIDGISLYPTVFNTSEKQQQHPYLYWEFYEQGGKQAIRMDNWKLIKLKVKHAINPKVELYDLGKDVSETKDVSSQHPDVVKKMLKLMDEAHTPSSTFKF